MKILATSVWMLGVIIMCLFFYLSWFRWTLFKWDAKKKAIELALLIIGSGLLIAGAMIYILFGP